MYLEGTIAWLPPRQNIQPEHSLGAEALDDGCFNHPVLILAADNARNEAVVLIITSFGGKDLEERHPKSTRVRSQYLPIYPSKEHPENGMRLFLADNERLFKNSYVAIKPCRTIKTTLLRRWRNGKYKLRDDSLRELVEHIDFESPWPKTIQTPSPVRAPRPVQHTPPEWADQYAAGLATIPTSYNIPSFTSTPPVRAAHSDYHVPVQWTTPSYTYSRYENTPLLHSNNIFESSSPSDDEVSACGAFTRVVVVIAALVGAAWYFNLF
ncbi:hypothetical protein IQ06DRAFT_303404 [Phaeosphaeriaceae sp. SRC1lsM3a]|nr:hypothetical protein IQ06DRAFT_303404 [Stagonospora sp. SRC1lsM3a]